MKPAIKRIWLTGTTLILLGSGPLFAQSALTPEQLTLRVERLTELSQRSEAKLSTAQDQLKTLSDEMNRMGRLVDNRAMLEMIQQVDQISEDINLLRGEIEVQGNDIGEIKKRQRELYKDIDRRLRDMESRTVGQAPVAAGRVVSRSLCGPGRTTRRRSLESALILQADDSLDLAGLFIHDLWRRIGCQ